MLSGSSLLLQATCPSLGELETSLGERLTAPERGEINFDVLSKDLGFHLLVVAGIEPNVLIRHFSCVH